MELPNYSNQLMQQLWALRKEGHFCDCSILVGDTRHQAHKLVLAASSLLFRSLLEGSDTISIDTAVVSPVEFGCLLHMLYTGRLPLGKHNVGRIVSAADSLQMFDVAVGFKKVLSHLVPPAAAPSPHASNHTLVVNGAGGDGPQTVATPTKDTSSELQEEPPCRRTHQELCESSEGKECDITESEKRGPEACERSASALCSQLVESLQLRPGVMELLQLQAHTHLDEASRKVLSQCCEGAEPRVALEKLLSQAQDGQMSTDDLLTLLRSVELRAPPSPPVPTEAGGQQSGTKPEGGPGADPESSKGKDDREEESGAAPSWSLAPPYSCRRCKKSFNYKCRLLAHSKRCPKTGGGGAPGTQGDRKTLQRQRSQQRAARPSKRVTCDLCTRSFAHPSGMIYHKRTEHFEEKPFVCEECGAKFGANSSLKNHMRLHTGEKPFDCKHCDMSFTVAAALAYHTKKKHSEGDTHTHTHVFFFTLLFTVLCLFVCLYEGKMYACQYCKAVFAQSIELTRHVRTHTGDRPYVCRECGKGYSQASGLTIHLQTFHKLSEPQDCQKCSLSFSSLEEHQKHIEDFHSKDFHKCPTCSKVFTSALLLDKHKVTHTGTKPFRCDLCNKSYQQLSGLWYHNRTTHPDVFASHTRQLKSLVQCDVCFKFFPSFTSVVLHQAAEHHDSKVSAGRCPLCPAVLDQDEDLQDHIRSVHTSASGEAFSCLVCSLVCTSQLELQEHLLACHVEAQQGPREGGPASISYTVVSTEPAGAEPVGAEPAGAEPVVQPEEQQRVLVALAGGTEGVASAELVEVNMYELLNNSVTFICEDRPTGSDTPT